MTQRNNGFTLVELAIALMVIGLLIGGVLKGQELIENARITRTVKDLSDFDTAIMIFRTTYNDLPGDIRIPTRLPNCSATPCANTTGVGTGTYNTDIKRANFWRHLHAAGLISSLNEQNPVVANDSRNSPYNPFDGNYHVNYPPTWPDVEFATKIPLNMNVFELSEPAVTSSLPAKQTSALDSKMDDGKPFTGNFRTNNNCSKTEGTEVLYNAESPTKCRPYILLNSAN